MELTANAKINLTLDILRKREDGYHDLQMVMQSVSLADELTVTPARGEAGTAVSDLHFLPTGGKNLAQMAAAAFRAATGLGGEVDVSIRKHVPVCAGLAGGSADAAAVLHAMNELAGAGLFAGVLLMPVLPFLEDSEENVRGVVEGAAQAGAKFVYPALGVTMRQGQREYFLDGLERAFPGQGLKARYLRQYGERYQCASPRAGELWKAFTAACRERGILYDMKSIIRAATRGYGDRQLTFF